VPEGVPAGAVFADCVPAPDCASAAARISAMTIALILPGYERDAAALSFISVAAR